MEITLQKGKCQICIALQNGEEQIYVTILLTYQKGARHFYLTLLTGEHYSYATL